MVFERRTVGYALGQAVGEQGGKRHLGPVEPGAMLGREHERDPLQAGVGMRGREDFVEGNGAERLYRAVLARPIAAGWVRR